MFHVSPRCARRSRPPPGGPASGRRSRSGGASPKTSGLRPPHCVEAGPLLPMLITPAPRPDSERESRPGRKREEGPRPRGSTRFQADSGGFRAEFAGSRARLPESSKRALRPVRTCRGNGFRPYSPSSGLIPPVRGLSGQLGHYPPSSHLTTRGGALRVSPPCRWTVGRRCRSETGGPLSS